MSTDRMEQLRAASGQAESLSPRIDALEKVANEAQELQARWLSKIAMIGRVLLDARGEGGVYEKDEWAMVDDGGYTMVLHGRTELVPAGYKYVALPTWQINKLMEALPALLGAAEEAIAKRKETLARACAELEGQCVELGIS